MYNIKYYNIIPNNTSKITMSDDMGGYSVIASEGTFEGFDGYKHNLVIVNNNNKQSLIMIVMYFKYD